MNPPAIVSQGVSSSGQPIAGTDSAIGQRPVTSMAIAHSPFETLVVFSDSNISAERLSPSGMPLNTILLWSGNTNETPMNVAAAWNGSRYFVVWCNYRQLSGAFISPGGASTQPRPLLTESNSSEEFVRPDVAWDGRNFVVVVGERPSSSCFSCPVPALPNRFRVMRVSADGDVIDSSPLVITGTHSAAHVASSGTESLITLDGSEGVSTIMAHDEGVLTLDAETPLFPWYSFVASAVAWNGVTYAVAWRYVGSLPGQSWLGAAQVTRSGLPFGYSSTAAGSRLPFNIAVSIGVNDAGMAAVATSELTEDSSSNMRARLYLTSELGPMPAPPAAPTNLTGYFDGPNGRLDWQQAGAEAGYAVEVSLDAGKNWNISAILPAGSRSAIVDTFLRGIFKYQYRVRALGPGGASEAKTVTMTSVLRRRAERP
jgi:hypothetical protein